MRGLPAFLFLALMATALLPAAVAVPAQDDQDRARQALAEGRILPLPVIVEQARQRFGGTVLDAEYEDDEHDDDRGRAGHGRAHPRYEIKLLTADGRVLELCYDAVSGNLIDQRGRLRHRHRAGHGPGEDD